VTIRVSIDGQLVDPQQARVSVLDRGFLYGDSVFETLRTYAGSPFALGEHLERLEESARRVLIRLPVEQRALSEEVRAAIAAAGNPESFARVMVTRGVGELGLDPGSARDPLRVIIVAPLVPPDPRQYAEGVPVITYRAQRIGEATGSEGAKVGNYLTAVLAMREARAAGAVEALILGSDGCILEGSTSNVFFVRGRTLVTPPLASGILAGITRAHVLSIAAELGLETELATVRKDDLEALDECFISSSIREILPVVRIDDCTIGSEAPGATTLTLLEEFRRRARDSARRDAERADAL
jgi:branched-chain amino acid aminotransferase